MATTYSNFILELRRLYGDVPKSSMASRAADGVSNLFNLGKLPILENSYAVYFDNVLKAENVDYSINLDSGDLTTTAVQNNGVQIKVTFKYCNWRDQHWLESINRGLSDLNGRGFFKQITRANLMSLSANVRTYNAPSACIDLYEVMAYDANNISGGLSKLPGNWSYQQDANKMLLGFLPSVSNRLAVSYLRNLQRFSATSATIDVNDEWLELITDFVGSDYTRYMAVKISQQGAATVDEGHFSFTNFRVLYKDLTDKYEILSKRKKPTRPAKDIQNRVDAGGYGG